jgi:hypothetical protein
MEETERGDPGGDVPALSAMAELREPDPRSMMWIVGGAAAPEAAAENHKRLMTQLLLAGEPGHADEGECESCPVETIRSSTLPAVLRLAERLGADVMPRPVQAARVTMSHMPTCNRILPGSGWDIPPDDTGMLAVVE